ncbi:MAG: hypothetical protein U0N29_03730 [Ligilactobacillus salivarius]
MSINIKLDEKYYITDNSYNTAILAKKLGINKNGKRTEKRRYFTDFGRAIVAWARETGKLKMKIILNLKILEKSEKF